MKKLLIACLVSISLLITSNAFASEQSHQKAAENLLDMVKMEESMDKAVEMMLVSQLRQNPGLIPYKDTMLKFFKKYMSFDSFKTDLVKMYTQEFTEQEIKDIIVFYKTPTGQKTIEKMPRLMSFGAQLGMKKVQANLSELRMMIKAESERLRKIREEQNSKAQEQAAKMKSDDQLKLTE